MRSKKIRSTRVKRTNQIRVNRRTKRIKKRTKKQTKKRIKKRINKIKKRVKKTNQIIQKGGARKCRFEGCNNYYYDSGETRWRTDDRWYNGQGSMASIVVDGRGNYQGNPGNTVCPECPWPEIWEEVAKENGDELKHEEMAGWDGETRTDAKVEQEVLEEERRANMRRSVAQKGEELRTKHQNLFGFWEQTKIGLM